MLISPPTCSALCSSITNFTSKLCLVSKKACLCWRSSKMKAWRPKINAARRRIPLLMCYDKKKFFNIFKKILTERRNLSHWWNNDRLKGTVLKVDTGKINPLVHACRKFWPRLQKVSIFIKETNSAGFVFAKRCIKCVNILCAFHKRRSML